MRTSIIKIAIIFLLSVSSLGAVADLVQHEGTCAELGFKKRTPAYGECVLELDQRQKTTKVAIEKLEQIRRQENINRESDIAKQQMQQRGDGSVDHQTCNRFGFIVGTATYSDCRLKIDIAKREQAQRQATYDAELRRYQEEQRRYDQQVAEYEREKERQKGLALMRFGAALAGGTSPHFSENLANAGRQSLGLSPVAPTRPQIQNFTITNPAGRMTSCTVFGNNINCN